MHKNQLFNVLILAAGTASRFGAEKPKQYQNLSGKPVLRHAIDVFLSHPQCRDIRIVINPTQSSLYEETVNDLNLPKPVDGGYSRKQSCYNGLKSFQPEQQNGVILVHDAARPFVSYQDIDALLETLKTSPSVTLGKPIPETIRRADSDHNLTDKIDRTNCWALQTPQGFWFQELLAAHEKFKDDDSFTDDCSVMEANGHQTKIVKRTSPNIKITWEEDLKDAEVIMSQNKITVIGQGFDVHAFGNDDVKNIRLGGIDVQHSRNLVAHSDGDVILHALTDAILGSIGEGDIGLHFPPSDDQWRDKDSTYFLLEAYKMLQKKIRRYK